MTEKGGKTGGTDKCPVGTETEEMDHKDSVGPGPLCPRRKRESR